MKKPVLISIKGTQKIENETNTTELMTEGFLVNRKNSYYLIYDESGATGFEGSKTTVKIEGDKKVTIIRNGKRRSQLIVEGNKRNIGYYDTGYGELMLGVSAQKITTTINNNGGDLKLKYVLDINSALVSENELFINVK